jgi:hypothetical protein
VELLSDRLLASAEGRDSKCRKTRVCEFVCVAVTHFDLDPSVFDCLVYPSLKISISYFDEIIASKCAARANFISRKNAKDLASDFFIRWYLGHLLSFAQLDRGARLAAAGIARPMMANLAAIDEFGHFGSQ